MQISELMLLLPLRYFEDLQKNPTFQLIVCILIYLTLPLINSKSLLKHITNKWQIFVSIPPPKKKKINMYSVHGELWGFIH